MATLNSFCITISLLVCALFTPQGAQAQDPLAWMEAVAPPFFIHDGELKGQGYEDIITDILIANLPQYHHTHMKANISRHYQQWKHDGRLNLKWVAIEQALVREGAIRL